MDILFSSAIVEEINKMCFLFLGVVPVFEFRAYILSHSMHTPFLGWAFFKIGEGLANFTSGLGLSCDSPDFFLLSS
jgi:ABC-type Co2+ transport system permease subunit